MEPFRQMAYCAYALCSLVFYLCKCISHHTKHLLMYEDIHRSTGLGLPLIWKVSLKKNLSGDFAQSSCFFNLIHHEKDANAIQVQ